jgi:hypothetical protein
VRGAVSSRRTALIALADATCKERFPIQRICQTLISAKVFKIGKGERLAWLGSCSQFHSGSLLDLNLGMKRKLKSNPCKQE